MARNPVFGRYGSDDLSEFSLRDIKYARARVALLSAMIAALEKRPAVEILVRDLCRTAEVSEPSFYNYFPQKDDLFLYLVRLWSVDSCLYARDQKPGLRALAGFYTHSAEVAEAHPYLMKELLAYQARADIPKRSAIVPPPTLAEKAIIFGRAEGLADVPDTGIRPLIVRHLEAALKSGELPRQLKSVDAALAIGAVFFGVAGLMAAADFVGLAGQYRNCLNVVFRGLGATKEV